MNEKLRKQQELASIVVNNVAKQIEMTLTAFPDPGEKITMLMSLNMVGLSGLAAITAKSVGPDKDYIPTQDHILFACLMTSNSVEFDRNGGLKVEFDMANVIKAMDQFKDMTGRTYDIQMNDSLLETVNEVRTKAASESGEVNKFLPQ